MPAAQIDIGPFTVRLFPAALIGAMLVSLWLTRRRLCLPAGTLIDIGLLALAGGLIGARLGYVLLNLDAFAADPADVLRFTSGGLNWHGALIGALIGLWLAARWRSFDGEALLDALTPAIALVGLAAWAGCWAESCGYGVEVDTLARYPAYLVAELPDRFGIVAPRYSTQLYGVVWMGLTLAAALLLMRGERLKGRRFWLTLALASAGMFTIGFWRADPSAFALGLRVDQLLDALFVLGGVIMALARHALTR